MPAVGDEVELDLGPCLLQLPRGDRRGASVVAALDDDARNALQLDRVAQQLAFLEPAVRRHVMILDPRDGDGYFGAGEMLDRLGAWKQSDDITLPLAPGLGRLELDVPVRAGQLLAIGFDQVAALAFGDRRQEFLELVRIDL